MTDRIQKRLALLKGGEYRKNRRPLTKKVLTLPEGTDECAVDAILFHHMLTEESPLLFADDRMGFHRTVSETPIARVGEREYIDGPGNVTPNYAYILGAGLDAILARVKEKLSLPHDAEAHRLYEAMRDTLTDALAFADRTRAHAERMGAHALADSLSRIPHGPAVTFLDACVFIKFLQFILRCNRNWHVTLGGFDKYMLPYFEADLARGVSRDELFETLEELFISLNFDTDIYFGAQQGDNGMSLVLGGKDADGTDRYSRLSEMCLIASTELSLIDPKINLRVDKETPLSRLALATELTRRGLGFPQYANDDIVIPGLLSLGYAPRDAYDYVVAACWEFIVPGCAFDIPNEGKVNFPLAVSHAVAELPLCPDFPAFFDRVTHHVKAACHAEAQKIAGKIDKVSPLLSALIDDCIERGRDAARGGARYQNYGAHGVGIAPAADAIMAVKCAVFDEGFTTKEELLSALAADFEGYAPLRNRLADLPKMGNDNDEVDGYASHLMTLFSDVFAEYKNIYGGCLRAGTGSAMEYILSAREVGATADGRRAYTPFGSSFSPAPTTRLSGPLSFIRSFTKHDLTRIINGGPLTMEIHDTVFRNADGITKVAALVKAFIDRGGHQLQINATNRDVLLDAQKHPENYKNLIVRVWGWSGYFCELDTEYQDHIISRTEFMA